MNLTPSDYAYIILIWIILGLIFALILGKAIHMMGGERDEAQANADKEALLASEDLDQRARMAGL